MLHSVDMNRDLLLWGRSQFLAEDWEKLKIGKGGGLSTALSENHARVVSDGDAN